MAPNEPVDNRHCFFKFSTAISRIWGMVTAAVFWSCTIQMFQTNTSSTYINWYLLGMAIFITFLETTWIINKCACCRQEGICCACWQIVVWVDEWKRTILYIIFSIPCFLGGLIIYPIICGSVLLVSAILYFMKSFNNCSCVQKKTESQQYIQVKPTTMTSRLVEHEVQTNSREYAPAGQGAIEKNDYGITNSASSQHGLEKETVQPQLEGNP